MLLITALGGAGVHHGPHLARHVQLRIRRDESDPAQGAGLPPLGWLLELLHLTAPVNWLGDASHAFEACIITNVWLGFPFMMVIALGGMQGIPAELYEAARIDRASRWQQFWHITLPLLKPVLLPAVTLGTIWTFNNLNVIWLVSNGGEPQDSTHILVSYVYKAVFNLYRYGYGAALSMVMFVILLAFSLVFLNRTRPPKASTTRRSVIAQCHARTETHHRPPARRAAGVRGDLDLSGAQRVLDFAPARQSAAVDRPVDHSRRLDASHSYVAALHRAAVPALARQFAARVARW